MTPQELVKILDAYLFGAACGDIERASNGNAKMAGFILGCCFIDAMAGYCYGIDWQTCKTGSRDIFKKFVGHYLPKYDPDKLYVDLRCGLVHSYTLGQGTYEFTDASKAGVHFSKTARQATLLNLEDFVVDLKGAYQKFRNDVLDFNNGEVFINAKHRCESMGYLASLSR